MPIRPIPVPELQVRLQDNSGIIDSNTDIDIPFLERQLSDFNQAFLQFFPNTNAPEYNLNIEALKSNIQQYLDEGLSHLGFYYGFQLSTNAPNSRNKIRLIMKGDKLDDDNPKIIARSSSRQFSDANLSLTNGSQFNSHRTRFKNRLAEDFKLFIVFDAFIWSGINNNGYSNALGKVWILGIAIYYLIQLFRDLNVVKLTEQPLFWISVGLITNNAIGLIDIFSNPILTYSRSIYLQFYMIWSIAAIFMYCCFAYAFWKYRLESHLFDEKV